VEVEEERRDIGIGTGLRSSWARIVHRCIVRCIYRVGLDVESWNCVQNLAVSSRGPLRGLNNWMPFCLLRHGFEIWKRC
jgi:hypothetical protein